MHSKIQQEKRQGFSKDAAARHLGLNWRTVNQYWDMTAEEHEAMRKRQYSSGLDKRQDIILKWLKTLEDVSAAQVQDWLAEHYSERYKERTVRDYVFKLLQQHGIPRHANMREYEPVPELPPGVQMQADFGVYNAARQGSRRIKLHFVIFILAHSRYKFIVWQARDFTSIDLARSLETCFEAIGGIPKELVIDQDHLMVVNENYGDIIYTHEFERCKNRHGFTMWVCRKSDPESKGMVESGVKFVKNNFAKNRIFVNLEQWSADCDAWLVCTGNGKKHAETKKIPAEVFQSEKLHLKPVISITNLEPCNEMLPTPVLKNNTMTNDDSLIMSFILERTLVTVESDYLSVDQFASMLQVDENTVYQWINRGKLRNAKRNGDAWLIHNTEDKPNRTFELVEYVVKPDEHIADQLLNIPKPHVIRSHLTP